MPIGECERIAVLPIAHSEVTLEVCTPPLVGRQDERSRLAGMADETLLRLLADQPMSMKDVKTRGAVWQ